MMSRDFYLQRRYTNLWRSVGKDFLSASQMVSSVIDAIYFFLKYSKPPISDILFWEKEGGFVLTMKCKDGSIAFKANFTWDGEDEWSCKKFGSFIIT